MTNSKRHGITVADPDPHPDPDPYGPYVFGPPGSASGSVSHKYGSGSVSQRYGSEDPDPYQNATDPKHCME
jgi:hypothetical protein